MCPTCKTRLDQSSSPQANQIRRELVRLQRARREPSAAKRALVAEYGSEVLADTPRSGFGALAWLAPTVLLLAGGGLAVLLARRWREHRCARSRARRRRARPARAAARRRARAARVSPATFAAAFGAGALSFATPCVLPLVPAYLAAVGGASVDDLRARRGVGRTLRGVAPFVLGFGAVFVLFGAPSARPDRRSTTGAPRSPRPRAFSSSRWA